MDKYEFNIKVEQIRKLAAKKEYEEAAAIARDMNWSKVKDWTTLATVINVQEAAGDYEEARDMAILAYNRNLGGRKLVYKLTEFFIKVGDFDNANELYEEYEKVSSHDANRFILYYNLRKAQNASDNDLVEILEDYKEQEIDEKYMYELARLYFKTGRREECIKTIDNIVLWFQDGIYVERAIQLKEKLNVDLTNTQRKILADVQHKKEDTEADREKRFLEEQERARLKKDDVGEMLGEAGTKSIRKESVKKPAHQDETAPLSMELVQNDQNHEIREYIVKALEQNESEGGAKDSGAKDSVTAIQPKKESIAGDAPKVQEKADFDSSVNKASKSLKELIENAKKKIENNYEKIHKEEEEEERRKAQARIDEKAKDIDIEVNIPDYSVYDTQRIQAELAQNMSDLFAEDVIEEDVAVLRPQAHSEQASKPYSEEKEEQEVQEEQQIEGQLDLADWMHAVQEKKYGKQNTREFSKAELERMLDEKEEKSAAYERLLAEKKAKESQAKQPRENIQLYTVPMPVITDEMLSGDKAEQKKETAEEIQAAASDENIAEKIDKSSSEIPFERRSRKDRQEQAETHDDLDVKGARLKEEQEEEEDTTRKLTGELAKIFRKYREMPGLESQLAELFDTIGEEMQGTDSSCGNILISGNSSSDKTDLARTIVRALNYLYPDQPKKIAKTTGESINQRGITKAMAKLRGTALIVEGAGAIQPKRINEILNCLHQDTDRMIVIFEDSDAEMNVLLNFNPGLTATFNHRIILKQYTVNELVEMAKRFARKRQYEVDDDALLELYLKIDKIHGNGDNIRLDDIKEVINQAIVNSEKRASKRLFGGLKKKHSENGDVIFLTEADFKER